VIYMSNEPTLTATLPPGDYVIGDPCYSIPDAEWDAWLEAADYTNDHDDHILAAEVNGRLCVGVYTAYGDGSYKDQDGNEFGVDAGLIGLVPVEVAEKNSVGEDRRIITLPFETDVEAAIDGVISLGKWDIDTDPSNCDWCGDKIDKGLILCLDCEEEQERQASLCVECSTNEGTTNEGLCDDCDADINGLDDDEDEDDGED
jgi:hypothetical protein